MFLNSDPSQTFGNGLYGNPQNLVQNNQNNAWVDQMRGFDQNAINYQDPRQIEATIHKMEGFLAMLNSLQTQTNIVGNNSSKQQQQQAAQQAAMQFVGKNLAKSFQNGRPNMMLRPTVHQVQR